MDTKKGAKKKVDINDIRADRGGDPEIYRRALSRYDLSSNLPSIPQASPPPNTHTDYGGERTASATYVDEALTLDSQRRSALTDLEGLRSKLSNLQRTVIAPKMKANEDVNEDNILSWFR